MASLFAPSYDGLALTTANGITFEDWEDGAPVRLKFEENLGDGQTIRESFLSGRSIEATLLVQGSTGADFNTKLAALMAVLHRSTPANLLITSGRQVSAYCSPGPVKVVPGNNGLAARIKVEWMAEDAYWLKTSSSTGSVVNTTSPVSFVATNNGNAPALPDFEIENTGATDHTGITVTIKNTTTGKALRLLQMDLDAGDKLIVKANGEVYIEAPAGATSKTPKRMDGTHPKLQAGANTLEFTHTFGSSSDVTFRATWYDAFHTYEEL
jgi:hypothetical protein